MYITTREMVISIICNACGVLGLILWAIEAHKANAIQYIQRIESVESVRNNDDIIVRSNLEPFRVDEPQLEVKGSERLVKGSEQADLVEDSPSLVKDLVKAFGEDGTWLERQGVYTLTLAEAKQRAVDIIESVLAKDEPTTQTETQNSNLTFKKRTMRDCYNCNRYEAEDECVECHYEPKTEPQTERSSE